jgi:hypothetical protein
MTKKIALFMAAAFAIASALGATEFPLKLKTMTAQETMSFEAGNGAMCQLLATKPDAIKKEPKASSKYPIYGQLELDAKTPLAFRLDESKGTGKSYDVLILDLNANGDLTDDAVNKAAKPAEPQSQGVEQVVFGPITVAEDKAQGIWRPGLCAELLIYNREMIQQKTRGYFGYLRVKSACYLETAVELNGVRQTIGVYDGNCNLRLGEQAAFETPNRSGQTYWYLQPSDVLLRDRNGNGRFDGGDFEAESEPFSSLVYFGPNPYTLALTKDLKTLQVAPYSGPVGELTVETAANVKSVQLARESSKGKWECVTPEMADGKCKAPAGAYRLFSCTLTGQAKDGATVAAMGMKRTAEGSIKVEPGQSATLVCGAPLTLKVVANKETQTGGGSLFRAPSPMSQVNINVQVVGAGGESYSGYLLKSKNRVEQPKPPQFKVLGANGKEVAAGQLEYG